jgi:hypothetical protein
MAEKNIVTKKLSDKNTKQEMLEAYQDLIKQIDAKRAAELNPERKLEEKASEEAVKAADNLTPDGVERAIATLKADIGKMLAELADKLADESGKYRSLQKAIDSKQRELQELYGIEKAAATLAALIESQNQKRRDFEVELQQQKEELSREIETNRAVWEKEEKQHELDLKEREALDKKARDREREDYLYQFKRDQQALKDQLNDEKTKLEKDLLRKREAADKELAEREKTVLEKERELAQLREKAATFPKELETTVAKTVQEAVEKIRLEAKNREDLLRKEIEGEKKVFTTQIASLQATVKDQAEQNTRLARQLETAYQKVQEIAEKAIEGSSQSKSFVELQKLLAEQTRKTTPDKA